ncbi:uncharacterized [Tachysurus ichikawai]
MCCPTLTQSLREDAEEEEPFPGTSKVGRRRRSSQTISSSRKPLALIDWVIIATRSLMLYSGRPAEPKTNEVLLR